MSGASGSGKTTLLRQLKPAIAPYGKRQGAVLYEGRPVEELEKRRAALEIGFVFQSPDAQIVTDRVSSELAFGLENAGVPPEEIRRRVAEMAGFFGIEGWYHKAIEALSGGQRQMLNLASVMVMNPKVLILDEPTSQLDPVSAGNFIGMLEKLNRELGQTILLTEHRQEELFPLADRIGMMEQGRLKQALPPKEMAAALLEEQAPLSKALPTPAKIAWALGRRADLPLTMKEGRGFLAALPPSGHKLEKANPPEPGEKILEAKNLFFRYDKDAPDVLRDFSLTLEKGRCLAVLGGKRRGKNHGPAGAGGHPSALSGAGQTEDGQDRLSVSESGVCVPNGSSAGGLYSGVPKRRALAREIGAFSLLSKADSSAGEESYGFIRRGASESGSVQGDFDRAGCHPAG